LKKFQSKVALGAFLGYKLDIKFFLSLPERKYTKYGYQEKALEIWRIMVLELRKLVYGIKRYDKKKQKKLVIFGKSHFFGRKSLSWSNGEVKFSKFFQKKKICSSF
jgi:hypothetical protein